eukprot:jgi/Hompol1/3795/HPOL_003394-RA
MSGFASSFFSAASSLGSRVVATLSEANASLDAQKDSFLKAKREKDGGEFTEAPEEALIIPGAPLSKLSSTLFESVKGRLLPAAFHETETAQSTMQAPSSTATATATAANKAVAVCPWIGVGNADMEASLRDDILNLSKDTRNFLSSPPEGTDFTFSMAEYHNTALLMLKIDGDLKQMRFDLVPKKIKDDMFWRNYFYRVQLLKQQALINATVGDMLRTSDAAIAPPAVTSAAPPLPIVAATTGDSAVAAEASSDSTTLERARAISDPVRAETTLDSKLAEQKTTSTTEDLNEYDDFSGDAGENGYSSDWETQLQAELGDLEEHEPEQ